MHGGSGGAPCCLQKTLDEATKLFLDEDAAKLKARLVAAKLKDSFMDKLLDGDGLLFAGSAISKVGERSERKETKEQGKGKFVKLQFKIHNFILKP